jgi:hypothetical protein
MCKVGAKSTFWTGKVLLLALSHVSCVRHRRPVATDDHGVLRSATGSGIARIQMILRITVSGLGRLAPQQVTGNVDTNNTFAWSSPRGAPGHSVASRKRGGGHGAQLSHNTSRVSCNLSGRQGNVQILNRRDSTFSEESRYIWCMISTWM